MANSSYTSDELFHLVGRSSPQDHERNFDTFLKILRCGCISYPPNFPRYGPLQIIFREDRSLLSEDLIVSNITCYCDIPFDHLQIHTQKYGTFGLSFRRDLLIRYGARPVLYVPLFDRDWFLSINGRMLINHIEQIYRGFRELLVEPVRLDQNSYTLATKPSSPEDAVREMDSIITKDFLAFLKPFNSELARDHPDNFYMEREWRKLGSLEFQPDDVEHVLVKRGYVERLVKEFPVFSEKLYIAPE